MEENIKNKIIIGLIVLNAIFFVSTIGSCGSASKLRRERNTEVAAKYDLEEKVNKFTQEKAALGNKLDNLTQELEAEKAVLETTKKELLQEQLINQSLKDEMQKITKLKEALEEDLKEALVKGKSAKTK